jgi:hypothetical protein
MSDNQLTSLRNQFEHYKMIGEKTFLQLADHKLFWRYNEQSNSIAAIVNHLWRNMVYTGNDFLTLDGETQPVGNGTESATDIKTREQLLKRWDEGWNRVFNTIDSIKVCDFETVKQSKRVNEGLLDSIDKELVHYAYHVGQIVLLGKMFSNHWTPVSSVKTKAGTNSGSLCSER